MLKIIIIVMSLLSTTNLFALGKCTEWAQHLDVTCVINGNVANLWERQCEAPCTITRPGISNYQQNCDLENICMLDGSNPNDLQSRCSKWREESGITCRNPNSGDWEQAWTRSCQVGGLATSWCSNINPN